MQNKHSVKKILGILGCCFFWAMSLFVLWICYRNIQLNPESNQLNVEVIRIIFSSNLALVLVLFGIKTVGGTVQQIMNKPQEQK